MSDPVAEAQAVLDAWPDYMTGRHTPAHVREEFFARRNALASMIALNRTLLEPQGDEGRELVAFLHRIAGGLDYDAQVHECAEDHYDAETCRDAAAYIERQSAALAAKDERVRVLEEAAKCALGHMTGNTDGDWSVSLDPCDLLRRAILGGTSHD